MYQRPDHRIHFRNYDFFWSLGFTYNVIYLSSQILRTKKGVGMKFVSIFPAMASSKKLHHWRQIKTIGTNYDLPILKKIHILYSMHFTTS